MSLWTLVHQDVTVDEWLLEDGFRFMLEDGSGSWVLEA